MIRNQTLDIESNRQWDHQIMLFLSHSRRCSLRFLTQTDYELRRIFDARITTTVISQVKEFRCEDHDDNDFSNQRVHRFRNLCYRTYERILIISKNFDVKKKARVRHSKFKSTESVNRISIESDIQHDHMQSKHRIRRNAVCISLNNNKQ